MTQMEVAMATNPVENSANAKVAAESAAAARVAEKLVAKAPKKPVTKVKSVRAKPVSPKVAAKPAAKIEGIKTMTDTAKNVEANVKAFAADASEKAQTYFNDMTARAKTAFEKSGETVKDVAEFNKANLEAMVESMKIAAKGTQTAAQHAAEYGRKNFDATTAMLKSAAAVKSPMDLFKLQGEFAKSQFEGAVAEMSRSSEFTLKLMGDVFAPIQNRYAVAAEKVKSFAA
jgi:phasin family protein